MKLISLFPILFILGSYGSYECERIAKDVQTEYGANLALIMPLQDNGAYQLGDYAGHWINYKKINGQEYFIDWGNQLIFNSRKEAQKFYYEKSELFIIGIDNVPFPIIWHY